MLSGADRAVDHSSNSGARVELIAGAEPSITAVTRRKPTGFSRGRGAIAVSKSFGNAGEGRLRVLPNTYSLRSFPLDKIVLTRPPAPEGLPQYLAEGVPKQDDTDVRALQDWIDDLLEYRQDVAAEDIDAGEGESIEAVEEWWWDCSDQEGQLWQRQLQVPIWRAP